MMQLSDYIHFNPTTRLARGETYPFVPMEALIPGLRSVRPTELRILEGSGSHFAPKDTLFARITPCLENGKIAQYDGDTPGFGSTEFIVLRAKEGKADPNFVYYFLLLPEIRKTAEKSMRGASGRQRASAEAVAAFQCTLPPLTQQSAIARVLARYDDLIENNLARMLILERMALSLYREWFLALQFPGSELPIRNETALDRVPSGWDLKVASECLEINPRISMEREAEKPFVPMTNLASNSMVITEFEARAGTGGAKFQNDDTLFARITPCLENGKTAFVQFLPSSTSVAFGSTEFIVLRSRTLSPEFVYCLARSDEFRANAIKSMRGASGRQRVNESCFDTFLVPCPPKDLLERFTALVRPSFRLIQSLHLRNQNLRRTRDLLLPRLMSGQVELKSEAA